MQPLKKKTLNKEKHSRFFGLMVVESTDIGSQKTLIISCKIISFGTVSVHYLGDIPIGSNGDAATLYKILSEFLQSKGIDLKRSIRRLVDFRNQCDRYY